MKVVLWAAVTIVVIYLLVETLRWVMPVLVLAVLFVMYRIYKNL